MKLEAEKSKMKMTKEERKQQKFESFCCKLYWIGCLCECFFLSSIFLRLMDSHSLIVGRYKIKSFDWLRERRRVNFKCCMQRRSEKNFFSICYLTRYAMPWHSARRWTYKWRCHHHHHHHSLTRWSQNFSQVKLFIMYIWILRYQFC